MAKTQLVVVESLKLLDVYNDRFSSLGIVKRLKKEFYDNYHLAEDGAPKSSWTGHTLLNGKIERYYFCSTHFMTPDGPMYQYSIKIGGDTEAYYPVVLSSSFDNYTSKSKFSKHDAFLFCFDNVIGHLAKEKRWISGPDNYLLF